MCKECAPLSDIEVVRADAGLAMFGLRIGGGDAQTCLVFRGSDGASVAAFLDALRLEMDLAVALKAGSAVREESDL